MIQIRTKDADEATFYWVQPDMTLNRVETSQGYKRKILWFVFNYEKTEQDFQQLRFNYRNGKTLVQPKAFSQKRAQIKNLIRENIFG